MTASDSTPDPEDEQHEEIEIERRHVAKVLAAVAGAGAIGGFFVSGIAGLSDAGKIEPEGPAYVKGTRLVDKEGNPVNAKDALPEDQLKTMTVYPEKEGGGAMAEKRTATILVRFPKDKYKEPTKIDALANGYAAYSKVCTHEGCLVSSTQGSNLLCPCHQSVYDPTQGAKVVGGPAPRALPQLPIGVTDDSKKQLLIATGPFEGPIGPEG
ncbi:MAG: ubiquinol-cytochrome c reductase iron-sulfur subunit [Haloarculaceae archaeon]